MLNFNFAVILKTLNVDMWILVTSWSQAFPPPHKASHKLSSKRANENHYSENCEEIQNGGHLICFLRFMFEVIKDTSF